jgi:hypothetical protein
MGLHTAASITVYERFETQDDPYVCARCRLLHGAVFAQGAGPQTPLHGRCRCRRVFAYRIETGGPEAAAPAPIAAPAPAESPAPAPLPWPLIPVILDPPDEHQEPESRP